MNENVWGRTKNDFEYVHRFENNRRKCPGEKRHQHGWLFYALPGWLPEMPGTCPVCRKMLEDEKILEQAGKKNQKMKV